MRHRKGYRKLGRRVAHRRELLTTLVCALIENRRIVTTLPKAKEARVLADKMVTLGKKAALLKGQEGQQGAAVALRRRAVAILRRPGIVGRLFDNVAPGFAERAGGYTRIIRKGPRRSDASEMCILEWVNNEPIPAPAAEGEPTT